MGAGKSRRGVSKAEWLEAGLETLTQGSVSDVTIERLARLLGIARSGFYWHFKDRRDLLRGMLAHWNHEVTEVVSENPEVLALEPKRRLETVAEMILDHDLTRYEMAIRLWALRDPEVARAVRTVNRTRLEFVSAALSELGFRGDDLDMRAMLFIGYHTWDAVTFTSISRRRRRALIARRIELITAR